MFNAWDDCISRLHPGEWAVLTDGDTAFLLSDFGHQLQYYFNKYPDTGIFTTYASRCHYACQVRKGTNMESDSIRYHKSQADKIYNELNGKVKEIDRRIAGHLIAIKKETWLLIREDLKNRIQSKGKKILGFDTQLSYSIKENGLKIRLMRGIYLFHYLRLNEGFGYKNHLV